MTEINEQLLEDFDVYARGITGAKHKMTPRMWPNSYKFFEEGWKAGYAAIPQVKEVEVNEFDWKGLIVSAAVGALIGNIVAEILIYFWRNM